RAAFLPVARGVARCERARAPARREHAPHGRGGLQRARAFAASGDRENRRRAAVDEGAAMSTTLSPAAGNAPAGRCDPVVIGSCGSNLASLGFAFERLGVDAPVTEDPDRVRAASHVILPGVGAAGDGMERLRRAGLAEVVPTLTQPVLG